jgi:hypothetical protein
MLSSSCVTLATYFGVVMYNQLGLGIDPSFPFGNVYIDAESYELLFGADGVSNPC